MDKIEAGFFSLIRNSFWFTLATPCQTWVCSKYADRNGVPNLQSETFFPGSRAHFCYQFQKHLLSTEMPECIKNSLFNKGVHVTCNQGNRITAVMTQNLTGSVFFYQKNLDIFLHCHKFSVLETQTPEFRNPVFAEDLLSLLASSKGARKKDVLLRITTHPWECSSITKPVVNSGKKGQKVVTEFMGPNEKKN